jgi:RNA polymerase sigma factor (sigma-70 family)
LVALARDGHEPAFEALVRRYRKELLSYCRRLQPQSGSAEDAVQQTLLQAWRALGAGAEVRDVRPWLYRIAHNVSLNNLRGAIAVANDLPETAAETEVDQLVENRLQVQAALAGMAALPTLQRQVFLSATIDGASHEELASEMGLSTGAVRGLIYRARATLRAAAAAVAPNPVVHWAIRRAQARPGRAAVAETIAGGGGAGAVALVAKGGAVLALAGAVAGAGGALLAPAHRHDRVTHARLARSASKQRIPPAAAAPGSLKFAAVDASRRHAPQDLGGPRHGRAKAGRQTSGREGPTGGGGHTRLDGRPGSGGTSSHDGSTRSGKDGASSGGSSGRSDGASGSGATVASGSGTSPDNNATGSGGSSGSSDGGSSGSSGGSTTTTSSAGGSTSGGGGATTDGDQLTLTQVSSSGGSSSDGSSSSSVDTATTSGSH